MALLRWCQSFNLGQVVGAFLQQTAIPESNGIEMSLFLREENCRRALEPENYRPDTVLLHDKQTSRFLSNKFASD